MSNGNTIVSKDVNNTIGFESGHSFLVYPEYRFNNKAKRYYIGSENFSDVHNMSILF